MHDYLEIYRRCKEATGHDRELEADIAYATGWIQNCDSRWGIGAPHWFKNGRSNSEIIGMCYAGEKCSLPYFTFSTDAALINIPEGFDYCIQSTIDGDPVVTLSNREGIVKSESGKTVPLAILATSFSVMQMLKEKEQIEVNKQHSLFMEKFKQLFPMIE